MPPFDLRVQADGSAALRRKADQLRRLAGSDFEAKLAQTIRDESRAVLVDVRAAALAVEVTSSRGGTAPPVGGYGPPQPRRLRGRIAGATYVSATKQGVSFRVSGKRVGRYGTALARYLDGTLGNSKRWRHPVFQNPQGTAPWTWEQGQPWFFVTITKNKDNFERALRRAIARMAREVR